jgi:hypothetical protein
MDDSAFISVISGLSFYLAYDRMFSTACCLYGARSKNEITHYSLLIKAAP